uniref:Alternative protein SGCA n=1 Tax=Homo sapiens TaxID=9606 RepID=L8EC52_HUMAN|nr:alternative protein SGCA [Homo sapiens]
MRCPPQVMGSWSMTRSSAHPLRPQTVTSWWMLWSPSWCPCWWPCFSPCCWPMSCAAGGREG